MTLLIDTAPLVELADATGSRRASVLRCLQEEPGPFLIPAPITAEIDYLLGELYGSRARRTFLADLAAGRFRVGSLGIGARLPHDRPPFSR